MILLPDASFVLLAPSSPVLSATVLSAIALAVMLCALTPAVLFIINLRRYLPPPPVAECASLPSVSVLIPARNEELSIAAAVSSILASSAVDFELIVLDDSSTDRTTDIVRDLIPNSNGRLRLEHAPPLPAGWNGKQHACWALARLARFDTLCFIDADVRLAPDALARMSAFLHSGPPGRPAHLRPELVSGFPRQITRTTLEWLLLPLIHFVLLGFLPVSRMRETTDPSFSAGCGQFLMVRRPAYISSGGHAAIRETMHDGLRLPKLLRQHGFHTDLADLTHLATCRMYTSARQVWSGLAKNATEGLGAPVRIVPITVLLFLGQVAPILLALRVLTHGSPNAEFTAYTLVALVGALLPRLLAARRFRQPLQGAILHPVGILLLLAIQWYALARKLLGSPVSWKQRSYIGDHGLETPAE